MAAFHGEWRVRRVERDGEKTEPDEDAVYTVKGNPWPRGEREIGSIALSVEVHGLFSCLASARKAP